MIRSRDNADEVVEHLALEVLGPLRLPFHGADHGLPEPFQTSFRSYYVAPFLLLAVADGQPRDYRELRQAAGGHQAPGSAKQMVQNAMSFWRRLLKHRCDTLGCTHGPLLTFRQGQGYALQPGAVRFVDVEEEINLLASTADALRSRQPDRVRQGIDRGRQLFRGLPLGEVSEGHLNGARERAIDVHVGLMLNGVVAELLAGPGTDGARRLLNEVTDFREQLVRSAVGGEQSGIPLAGRSLVAICLQAMILYREGSVADCSAYLIERAEGWSGTDKYILETLERVLRGQGSPTVSSDDFLCQLLLLPADRSALEAATRITAPATKSLLIHRPGSGVFVGRRDFIAFFAKLEPRYLYSILGEAGVGKTALLQELVDRSRADSHLQIVCRCGTESLPGAILGFLKSLGLFRLEPIIGLALVGGLEGAVLPDGTEPEKARLSFERTLKETLERLSTRHQVTIYLDDLHLARGSTLALITELIRSEVNVQMVATTRPQSPSQRADQAGLPALLGHEKANIPYELKPLTVNEVIDLVLTKVPAEANAEPLARLLQRKTLGNALFLSEVLRYLTERDGLQVVDGALALTDGIVIGDALAPFVASRVGSLSSATQEALRLLSCSYPETPYAAARRLLGESLIDVIDEAVGIGLLAVDNDLGEGGIRFRHELLREAVYATIEPVARWRYHERLADSLANSPSSRWVHVIAYHYERAAMLDAQRAVDALRAAGLRAIEDLEIEEAADYFERARRYLIELGEYRPELDANLLFMEGDCRRRVGQAGHRELLVQSARLAEQHAMSEVTAAAAISLADAGSGFHAGILDTEIADFLRRAAEGLPRDALALRARLHSAIAVLISQTEMQAGRLAQYEKAEALAERSGDLTTLALVLPAAYWVYDTPDRLDDRAERGRRLVELSGTEGARAEFEGQRLLFSTAIQKGDLAESHRAHVRAEELLTELPEPACWWAFEYQRTLLRYLAGDLEGSEESAMRCQSFAQRAGMPETRQLTVLSSQILAVRDDQGRLHEMTKEIVETDDRLPGVPAWQCGRAVALFREGGPSLGGPCFDEIAEQNFFEDLADLAWLGGLVLLGRHVGSQLTAYQASLLRAKIEPWSHLNSWVASTSFGPAALAVGELSLRLDEHDRARACFAQALDLAESLNSPGFQARAKIGLACVDIAEGKSATAVGLLDDAQELIAGRGMGGVDVLVSAARASSGR